MFKSFLQDPYNKLIVLLVKDKRTVKEEEEIKYLVSNLDMQELFRTAKKHEVSSIMFPNIKQYYYNEEWEQDYVAVKAQLAWMIASTQMLAEALNEQNIPLIALKNAGITIAFMDDYGKCPMGDIDTLVRKNDFIKAHKIALTKGFDFHFRSIYEKENLETAFADGSTEYLYKDNGREMWLEIAWRAIAGRWINQKNEPKAEDLFNNAILLRDKGIYILSPEDNLLQVSIHTAKHSYIRKPGFRLHLDVERIVNYCDIDWEKFIIKVKESHTKTAVYFSLRCASDLFNTPIPNYVMDQLKPNRLKRRFVSKVIERGMALHGNGKQMGKVKFIAFQACLYDDLKELFAVAFPGKTQLSVKYSKDGTVKAQMKHLLDLAGIRKAK